MMIRVPLAASLVASLSLCGSALAAGPGVSVAQTAQGPRVVFAGTAARDVMDARFAITATETRVLFSFTTAAGGQGTMDGSALVGGPCSATEDVKQSRFIRCTFPSAKDVRVLVAGRDGDDLLTATGTMDFDVAPENRPAPRFILLAGEGGADSLSLQYFLAPIVPFIARPAAFSQLRYLAADGGAGDDSLGGGTENDELVGGPGNDRLRAGPISICADPVFVSGRDGAPCLITDVRGNRDLLDGGPGDDVLLGEPGANDLRGGDGNDQIAGGTGPDAIDGGPGIDRLTYDDADPIMLAPGAPAFTRALSEARRVSPGPSGVTVVLGDGTTCTSGSELDQGDAGPGGPCPGVRRDQITAVEEVTGTSGADDITGNSGANALQGLAGTDRLDGGSGPDRLLGGGDSDLLAARDFLADTDIVCAEPGVPPPVPTPAERAVVDAVDPVGSTCNDIERGAAGTPGPVDGVLAPSSDPVPPGAQPGAPRSAGGGDRGATGPEAQITSPFAKTAPGGRVGVRVRCVYFAKACAGTLELRTATALRVRAGSRVLRMRAGTVVGRGQVDIPWGQSAATTVALGPGLRRLQRAKRRLVVPLQARLVVHDGLFPQGATTTVTRRLRLAAR